MTWNKTKLAYVIGGAAFLTAIGAALMTFTSGVCQLTSKTDVSNNGGLIEELVHKTPAQLEENDCLAYQSSQKTGTKRLVQQLRSDQGDAIRESCLTKHKVSIAG